MLQLEAEQARPASGAAEPPAVHAPVVEQLRAECSQLQAEVQRLGACLAAAQREGAAELAEAAARAQAQQQVGVMVAVPGVPASRPIIGFYSRIGAALGFPIQG